MFRARQIGPLWCADGQDPALVTTPRLRRRPDLVDADLWQQLAKPAQLPRVPGQLLGRNR
jgi:hypothetical protein